LVVAQPIKTMVKSNGDNTILKTFISVPFLLIVINTTA